MQRSLKKVTINIVTIFPDQVKSYVEIGILNQAVKSNAVVYNIVNIRDFSQNKHKKVDGLPYGGGPGMVMKAPDVVKAIESIRKPGMKILLAPSGEEFDQKAARKLVGKDLTLISGRYTGIDYRVRAFVDKVMSVGNFIVSGGELPALIITEAVVRLIPGVLGDERSIEEDKGYPVYTRPRNFRGLKVPEVLISGNHKKIQEFRNREAKYD